MKFITPIFFATDAAAAERAALTEASASASASSMNHDEVGDTATSDAFSCSQCDADSFDNQIT